eukprot:239091-Karenia_brevis.AAC.1
MLARTSLVCQLFSYQLDTGLWIEWIDTAANIADPISRSGVHSWISSRHWDHQPAVVPDFITIMLAPMPALLDIVKH